MNIEYFKEELSNFLRRFTTPITDNDIIPTVAPLTNREIREAANDVINSKLDETLVDSSQADFKTPAAGIIVTTPHAPDIPKFTIEHGENSDSPERFRSCETLTSDSLRDAPIEQFIFPKPDPLSFKIEDNVDGINIDAWNARHDENKAISQSSSSSSVNMLVRSDTYVCENELENKFNNDVFGEKKCIPEININEPGYDDFSMFELNIPELRKKLKTLSNSASEVMKKIEDIEKVFPDNTRPIRRLSTIGCFPGMNRALVTTRTIQRPKMGRRSMTSFPGTPTSSRMSPGTVKNDSSILKGISTTLSENIEVLKLPIPATCRSVSSGALRLPKKSYKSPTRGPRFSVAKPSKPVLSPFRSVSSGALMVGKKSLKSPIQGARGSAEKTRKTPLTQSPALSLMNPPNETEGRPPKNPKYAHVQSTIPKYGTILGKRKADQF